MYVIQYNFPHYPQGALAVEESGLVHGGAGDARAAVSAEQRLTGGCRQCAKLQEQWAHASHATHGEPIRLSK